MKPRQEMPEDRLVINLETFVNDDSPDLDGCTGYRKTSTEKGKNKV